MKCACGWEGELATIRMYEDDDATLTITAPLCLHCRLDRRLEARRRGVTKFRVVPCRT